MSAGDTPAGPRSSAEDRTPAAASDEPPHLARMGLKALIFDLDGVITRTARLHALAWKALFDEFLRRRAEAEGSPFVPFDIATDYLRHVDGLPRYEGVRTFLASRGITLPEGAPEDPAEADTVIGLGSRKNVQFRRVLQDDGVEVFPGAVRFIEAMRGHGLTIALNSSSKNARLVLDRAGLTPLFDVIVDGEVSAGIGLPGKPAPDTFLHAASLAGATPEESAVFEDAVSGVQSGRAGRFRLVIGVDRGAGARALLDGGADIVVKDLGDLPLD